MLSSIEVEEWLRPDAESPRDCREKKNRINKLVRDYLGQTPIVNETKLGEGVERLFWKGPF